MQWPSPSVLIASAIGLASCSQEQAGYTGAERKCIARRYYDYKSSLANALMSACLNGTVVTCNTASSRARAYLMGSWLSLR